MWLPLTHPADASSTNKFMGRGEEMSTFGWDLPPGCSTRDLPGNQSYPCDVCGRLDDDCICPECFVCGSVFTISCYRAGHLVLSQEQIKSRQATREQARADAEAENDFWRSLEWSAE